jgi:bifunctional non-homologous end joining protein LigD
MPKTDKIKNLITDGRRAIQPKRISPMLCTLVKDVPISDNLIYEIKWDGFRIISYADGKSVRMDSRSGLDYTSKYPTISAELKKLKHKMVLDGEMVVFNEEGLPDFNAIQNYNGHNSPISYCVFDIIWLDGYDLKELPLTQRKEILKEIVGKSTILKYSESFKDGLGLYEQMKKLNIEGIVAKKIDSPYNEGERAYNWLKIPIKKRQEFVIGGWAESEKSRSFRSLLFGAYKDGQFRWVGRSGGGYKEKEMPGILALLKKIEIKESPFANKVLDTKGATIHWVKPKHVANFEFSTWTETGRIRKPATFLGFRKDKKPGDVILEIAKTVPEVEPEIKEGNKRESNKPAKSARKLASQIRATDKLETLVGSNWPELEKITVVTREKVDLGNCSITLTDVDREIWKKITKADLIAYYHRIAPYILPHLKDRPLSLHVKPYGATVKGFYIKDMEGRQPDCADIFSDERRHKKAGKRDIIDYLVCNNVETLLYMVNLGCIDINPWTSRAKNANEPDFIIIDLDPSDNDFKKATESAKAAKQYFDQTGLTAFVKTSGKTGIHLYLPCEGFTFPVARQIAEEICRAIHKLVPRITTTEVNIANRGNRLYIDPNQNDYADTVAAPYSVRPFKLPTVSMPLEWKEINDKLDSQMFTISTVEKRLAKKKDLWSDILNNQVISINSKVLSSLFDTPSLD